jgi:hypothetical protein
MIGKSRTVFLIGRHPRLLESRAQEGYVGSAPNSNCHLGKIDSVDPVPEEQVPRNLVSFTSRRHRRHRQQGRRAFRRLSLGRGATLGSGASSPNSLSHAAHESAKFLTVAVDAV